MPGPVDGVPVEVPTLVPSFCRLSADREPLGAGECDAPVPSPERAQVASDARPATPSYAVSVGSRRSRR